MSVRVNPLFDRKKSKKNHSATSASENRRPSRVFSKFLLPIQMATHALFETASGYAVFKVNFKEDIGSRSTAVQDSIDDLAKFGKMVSLVSFSPFKTAAHALENANDVSEGQSRLFQCSSVASWPSLGLCVY